MREFLSALSGVVFLLGFVPYITAILLNSEHPPKFVTATARILRINKAAQPSKASWFIWALTDFCTVAAMASKGSLNGIMVGATIGATTVMVLSIKYGKHGWSIIDKVCIAGSIVGIALYVWSDANASILINCTVMIIGSFPTFASVLENPERESKLAWTLYFVSCVIALIAIPHLTIEHAAQPISFTVTETVVMYLLFIHRRKS